MEENLPSLSGGGGSLDEDSPSYSLPGVLQFVQHEWARFERERSRWDVERAELQAKLAFLQGERRGQENLKFDLVRRIKMLEYALRQERLKYHQLKYGTAAPLCEDLNGGSSSSDNSASAVPGSSVNKLRPGRELLRQYLQEVKVTDSMLEVREVCRSRVLNAASDTGRFAGADGMRSRSLSTRSNSCSFSASDSNLSGFNVACRATTASPPPGTERPPGMVDFATEFKPARSPTGAAPGQLPHVTPSSSLTAATTSPSSSGSVAAPAPSPPGADMIETVCGDIPASLAVNEARKGSPDAKYPADEDADEIEESSGREEERFSAALSQEPPTWMAAASSSHRSPEPKSDATVPKSPRSAAAASSHDPTKTLSDLGLLPRGLSTEDSPLPPSSSSQSSADGACIGHGSGVADHKHPTETPSPGPRAGNRLSHAEASAGADPLASFNDHLPPGHLPASGNLLPGHAKDGTLIATNRQRRSSPGINIGDRDAMNTADLVSLTQESSSALEEQVAIEDARKVWAPKFSLHSHYDCVRSVVFHPSELMMLTASEDSTVKLWNLEKQPVGKRNALPELEPIHTFRGHKGAVLCTGFSPSGQHCFSGGLDGKLQQWNVCSASSELYGPYDGVQDGNTVLAVHDECIWDMSVHSVSPLVATASADGTACVWNWSSRSSQPGATGCLAQKLVSSHVESGKTMVPTSVDFVHNEPGQLMVSYQSGQAILYDYQAGKPVCSFTGIGSCQVNKVACHPTLSFSIAGLDDRRIVYLDHRTGQVMFSMLAHLDSVSCLSIDPTGLYFLSGSHDCSLRLWTIESRACVQEMTAHRRKNDEAVFSVAFHPSKGYLASGGADSVAKVFT
ncbi:striatin-4-like [Sycon ciliatum]|uniref:striatin-4-like n=1 Tax=Sycon ciliatum TaxID=27933 RepID=UPI0031F5F11F